MGDYYARSPSARSRSVTPISGDMARFMPSIADHTIGNHMGRSSGVGGMAHAKTYYNSARNQMYSRFSPEEWKNSNNANFGLSDRERNVAGRLRGDAWRLVKSVDERTRNRQASNTKKLGERVQDITFWKGELNTEVNEMDREIQQLKEHKQMLEKAYHDTKNPLAIAQECLLQREKRQGIDQVNDHVENALSKEVEIIKKCQDKMRRVIEKSRIQLATNRAAQHECEKDSTDKFHAQGLDDRMQQMRNSSGGIGYYPGIENTDSTITVPQSWVKFTRENIERSQRAREHSEALRGEIDSLMRQCANEMWSVFNSVNGSFQQRLQETTDARNKLQAHLQKTVNEIRDMDRSIMLLRKAIQDKEEPMKVAQTRLEERTRRINVELCNDPVMKGLQREVHEIRNSVKMLKNKLHQAEIAMARLLKTKGKLEQDIDVKENSLRIDSKYCMGMRKNMAMDPKMAPIFNIPIC